MSNYPPTPSFGGLYNFGVHWPPPPQQPSSNAHVPLPRNNQPRPSDAPVHHQHLPPPPFPPILPQDLQTLYNTNASNFTANSQYGEYLKEGRAIPPPPPPFPYPSPFASSSLPPPPFPPVPIPIPPGFHQSQPPAHQNQVLANNQQGNAFPQTEEPAVEIQLAETASVGALSTGEVIDREEGELSEEDFVEDAEHKQADTPISGRVSPAMGQVWGKSGGNDNNADFLDEETLGES
jgi:hypothetical protein